MNNAPNWILRGMLPILALMASGCSWIALGYNSSGYPTTASGEAANVVNHGSNAYVTLAEQGLEVFDIASGKRIGTLRPPEGSESIDDLAVADGFLFTLDARQPGHLSVFNLSDPAAPVLLSTPIAVDVGPFSGVSAGGGHVIVSGGTSRLSLRAYSPDGRLGTETATTDLGRGQPDILLSPDGRRAFVSTHYTGPYFGLTTADVSSPPPAIVKKGLLDLDTIGFTAGGSKPANFPIETALNGQTLLVAHVRGLALIGIENLSAPKLLSVLKLDVKPVNVDVLDGIAAVVGSFPKPLLVLIDVKNPIEPKVVRTIPLPEGSYATGVAIGPTHVIVSAHKKGALIFQR